MLSAEFINEMKQKLLASKTQLEQDLGGLKSHTELGDDMDDQVDEMELDEVNRDLIARMQSDLAQINKALAKIENNTYGTDGQGRQIPENRLRALPWADAAI